MYYVVRVWHAHPTCVCINKARTRNCEHADELLSSQSHFSQVCHSVSDATRPHSPVFAKGTPTTPRTQKQTTVVRALFIYCTMLQVCVGVYLCESSDDEECATCVSWSDGWTSVRVDATQQIYCTNVHAAFRLHVAVLCGSVNAAFSAPFPPLLHHYSNDAKKCWFCCCTNLLCMHFMCTTNTYIEMGERDKMSYIHT